MNRRLFLSSALASPLAQPAAGRIRIAFLGASHAHAAAKLDVVRENTAFELAGIAESDPAVRERYGKSGVRLMTREDVLGDASIRVVAVESDVKDHAADAMAALAAGKHIHLEKPPATDARRCRDIFSLAGRRRLLVQTGYMWRHHPGIRAALEAARQGWLGEVFMVRGTIGSLNPAGVRGDLARYRGGIMFELGCHLIDPMVRLLGRPVRVTPALQKLGSDGLADNTAAVLEFPRALGVIAASAVHGSANRHRAFEIFGTNGNAVLRPIEPAALHIDLVKAAGPYKAGIQAVELPPYKRYVGDFTELAEAVRAGRPLPVTPEEEMRVQEALLAASGMA